MKLIIKEYLTSLKEREELDAIIPDLLSQMGLNVYSRPGRGTRQDGVDVGAVGCLDNNTENVYLFSIKAGDLTRASWDSDSLQSLRPSLNEILDSYIPNRLPLEHKNKKIVICICCGGDVQEQVRLSLTGFIKRHTTDQIVFEEWNGDKIAELIQNFFLREEFLPSESRSLLRKSLAMLDDPTSSYNYFSKLVTLLSATENHSTKQKITAIRQISLCLGILFSWSKSENNLEPAYLASELALLHAWDITHPFYDKNTKDAVSIKSTFASITSLYHLISFSYLKKVVIPFTNKQHALSVAVHGACSLDINLKLFDVMGRLALGGLWMYWNSLNPDTGITKDEKEEALKACKYLSQNILPLIINNPILYSPIKDDQAIDISLALLLLSLSDNSKNNVDAYLNESFYRIKYAYETNGAFPCNLNKYSELLEHPNRSKFESQKEVTVGSILYPKLSAWAALYGLENTYNSIASFQKEHLEHCNFQAWYPDETSELNYYKNSESHGSLLSHINLNMPSTEFLKEIFLESKSPHFNNLSAIRYGLWPIILVATRHYRLPMPVNFINGPPN